MVSYLYFYLVRLEKGRNTLRHCGITLLAILKSWNIFFIWNQFDFFLKPQLLGKKMKEHLKAICAFRGVSIFSFWGNQRVFKFCPRLSILFVRIKSGFACLLHLWSQLYHYENFNKINMIDFTQCWNESWWYHLYESCMIIYAKFLHVIN